MLFHHTSYFHTSYFSVLSVPNRDMRVYVGGYLFKSVREPRHFYQLQPLTKLASNTFQPTAYFFAVSISDGGEGAGDLTFISPHGIFFF